MPAPPRRSPLAQRWQRLTEVTLPHVAVRPLELLQPVVLWRAARLTRELRAADLTMVTARRARTLYRLARAVERRGVPGAIVDCGVRNGGSTMLMSCAAPSREVWAFDSFQGLPAPTEIDEIEGPSPYAAGDLRGSADALRHGFQTYGNAAGLHVMEGWFADTLPATAPAIEQIAVLHVDADFYDPVRLALETFLPKVSPGGYVVVDDYFSFPGARRATDEVRRRTGTTSRIVWDHYWRA